MSVFKIKDKRLNHDRWCVQIWRNGKCYRYYDNPTTGKPFSGKSNLRKWNPSLLQERIFEYLNASAGRSYLSFLHAGAGKEVPLGHHQPRDKLLFTIFCYYGLG
jgi:hypothetical protein